MGEVEKEEVLDSIDNKHNSIDKKAADMATSSKYDLKIINNSNDIHKVLAQIYDKKKGEKDGRVFSSAYGLNNKNANYDVGAHQVVESDLEINGGHTYRIVVRLRDIDEKLRGEFSVPATGIENSKALTIEVDSVPDLKVNYGHIQ